MAEEIEPGDDSGISHGGPDQLTPFSDLAAPSPLETEPPAAARWLAFSGILIGGILGGMIGFGTADLLGAPEWLSALECSRIRHRWRHRRRHRRPTHAEGDERMACRAASRGPATMTDWPSLTSLAADLARAAGFPRHPATSDRRR